MTDSEPKNGRAQWNIGLGGAVTKENGERVRFFENKNIRPPIYCDRNPIENVYREIRRHTK